MKDNEIIQEATEAVTKGYPCAFYVPQLLEVIKNKDTEIFNLNKEISALKLKNDEFLKSNEKAKAEIERLSNFVSEERCREIAKEMFPPVVAKAKSEAYREFAERFKYFVLHEDIEIVDCKCTDYHNYVNGANQFRHQVKNGIDNTLKELTRNLHGTCTETTNQTATNHSVSLIDGHIEG